MPNITYPGHAGLLFEGESTNYFCDPWLLGEAVNNNTVWLYPPRRMGLQDLPALSFIYISHDHEDHCNIDTLKKFQKDIRIYILDFPNNNFNLLDTLKNLHFTNIIQLKPAQTYTHNENSSVTIFPSDAGYLDSSAIIEADGVTIYHGNDNTVYPESLAKIAERFTVDIAFLPYAGFSGFPACYEFPKDLRDKFALKKKNEAIETFFESANKLNCKIAVPAAGDLCLVGKDIAWVNYYDRATPDEIMEIAKSRGLGDKTLSMKAGDIFSTREGFIPHPLRNQWKYTLEDQVKFAERKEVSLAIEQYDRWLYSETLENFETEIFNYFSKGLLKYKGLAEEVGDYIFTLQIEGTQKLFLTIDFNCLTISREFNPTYNKKIITRAEVLSRIIQHKFLWADAYSSCKFILDRNPPDYYNTKFWIWLYSLDGINH